MCIVGLVAKEEASGDEEGDRAEPHGAFVGSFGLLGAELPARRDC